jgi:very-short-patch-repair endonuclease
MRAFPTRSEEALWRALRANALGCEVRRQVPIGRFIADFLVPKLRLVIEIDGGWHDRRRQADAHRDRALARAGYRVFRIPAEQVLRDLPGVLAQIKVLLGPR